MGINRALPLYKEENAACRLSLPSLGRYTLLPPGIMIDMLGKKKVSIKMLCYMKLPSLFEDVLVSNRGEY